MSLRRILSIACICIGVSACNNEPYQYPPLGLVGLTNHNSGITYRYHYRNERLNTFLSISSDTITFMKFHYNGDRLSSIATDSTKTSVKITSFYPSRESAVVDSTFLLNEAGTSVVSVRTVSYDAEGNPLTIDIATSGGREAAELAWENGNVVKLATYKFENGERKLVRDLAIGHDDQYCVYMRNMNYLFTLPLSELYWLSKNNPITFNDGSGEKKYTYWYNKLGYPSNFRTETNVLYGTTYIQVR